MFKQLHYIVLGISIAFFLMLTMTSTRSIEEIQVSRPDKVPLDTLNQQPRQEPMPLSLTTIEEPAEELPVNEEEPLIVIDQIEKSPYRDLLTRNKDYRGWITLDGTKVSYPLVKGEDNDYYLKRSFDGNYDNNGTVFMDYRNFGFGFSQHTILYGHNMKDGSMFGDLKKFKDERFALANRIIEIEDLYGTRYYEVYASYYAEADSGLIRTEFSSMLEFQDFVDGQMAQSSVAYGRQVQGDDRILTLVTCSYEVDDGRYLIHAVEVAAP